MHPELKAYLEAITKTEVDVQSEHSTARPDRGTQTVTATGKTFFAFVGELLEELGPYCCELRVAARAKQRSEQCSSQHGSSRSDAIGYHGLI